MNDNEDGQPPGEQSPSPSLFLAQEAGSGNMVTNGRQTTMALCDERRTTRSPGEQAHLPPPLTFLTQHPGATSSR